ncbi:hypothetical protein QTG54_011211 [Skeletonema marinoi]|uniref:LTD domain-containing protein n=1 Tax=Skeletonema marinoi TaxID=267567 RepID=A0AAD8Y2Q1_9STRA|nr:hypothetical protein QTG54_011211 [Skeletonema marinoi]
MAAATPPPPAATVASSASAPTAPTTTASNLPSQKELLDKSSSSTPTPSSPTAAAATTPSTASKSAAPATATKLGTGITISSINYDGQVPKTESDEYITILNNSKSPMDISGYYIYVATSGTQGPTFTFPKATKNNNPTVLKAGESVRIYTNEIHKESGGYSFGSGKAIWSNKGGLAVLKDGAGKKIGEFKY